MQEILPGYMLPQYFVSVEKFPLTSSGKLDRNSLPDPEYSLSIPSGFIEPQTDLEVYISSVWADVLSRERVGKNEDFFEMGGHSLLAVNMINRISKELEIKIPVRTLFEYSHLDDFSEKVEDIILGQADEASQNYVN